MTKLARVAIAALVLVTAGCASMGGSTSSSGGVSMSGSSAAGDTYSPNWANTIYHGH